jgi:hypothetical protein
MPRRNTLTLLFSNFFICCGGSEVDRKPRCCAQLVARRRCALHFRLNDTPACTRAAQDMYRLRHGVTLPAASAAMKAVQLLLLLLFLHFYELRLGCHESRRQQPRGGVGVVGKRRHSALIVLLLLLLLLA